MNFDVWFRKRGRRPRTPRENTIAKYMRKFKHRTLHSGSHTGPIVMKREQAIAIALSVAEKKHGPYVPKTAAGMKSAALRAMGKKDTKIGH